MRAAWKNVIVMAVLTFALQPGLGQLHRFKPGFNFFTRDQDIQLGKEAAAKIEKQVEVVNDKELNAYINLIGSKLAAQSQAGKYPYTFKVVNDPSINAFALPGGPTFVNTGLITAVDNEAQLAGVLAHEISHVALRHGTNQASKANLIQLPALLASKAVRSGSMLAQLSQLGIGLGANSVLLKFSRTAENQADLLGAQVAAQAGYNPVEIALFFKKLESEGGARGPQFFSDHPNPGNRMKAIENEMRYIPQKSYSGDTGQLARMKAIIAKLPAPKKRPAQTEPSSILSSPGSRRSFVCAETCPNTNWICSSSPPAAWQSRAHVLQGSCGVNLAIPFPRESLHHMPNGLCLQLLSSSSPCSADSLERPSTADTGGRQPVIQRLSDTAGQCDRRDAV